MEKLRDPADKVVKAKEEERLEAEGETFDIANLSLADFKQIPPEVAKSPHPFDGYPLGPKIKVGTAMISSTFIVGLNPKVYVHQDPSGLGVTIQMKKGKGVVEMPTNILGGHSRVVRNLEDGDINEECVFGFPIELKDGPSISCAVVRSHYARAQICFKLEPRSGAIQVDDRYLLLDDKQKNILRRTFILFHTPQARIDRLSRVITGESDHAIEEVEKTSLE